MDQDKDSRAETKDGDALAKEEKWPKELGRSGDKTAWLQSDQSITVDFDSGESVNFDVGILLYWIQEAQKIRLLRFKTSPSDWKGLFGSSE